MTETSAPQTNLRTAALGASRGLGLRVTGACLIALTLTACSAITADPGQNSQGTATHAATESGGGSPAATPSGKPLSLIVLGDSISLNENDVCPACTGFVDQWAASVHRATGRPVAVDNLAGRGWSIPDLAKQLSTDPKARQEVAAADLILVSIGNNDGPPWPTTRPCGGQNATTGPEQVVQVQKYTYKCIAATIASYRPDLAGILRTIDTLRSGRPQVRAMLTIYSNWNGNPQLPQTMGNSGAALTAKNKVIYDSWNAMACATATSSGFACVDTYHAFDGSDGLGSPAKYLAEDYTHPNQAGNDAIGALLAKIAISPITKTA